MSLARIFFFLGLHFRLAERQLRAVEAAIAVVVAVDVDVVVVVVKLKKSWEPDSIISFSLSDFLLSRI